MAYAPVQLISTPFEDYAGYWIKFYEQGGVTPLSMATDATGGTLIAEAEISSGAVVPIGFIQTAGDALLNPFINGAYDCWIFPTEAEAAADDTTNAIQIADNLNADPASAFVGEWGSSQAAIQTSTTTFTVVGDQTADFHTDRRIKATGGADRYATIVSSAFTSLTTVTVKDTTDNVGATSTLHASMDTVFLSILSANATSANGNYYRALSGETGITSLEIPYGDVRRYGAAGSGDETTVLGNAVTSAAALGIPLKFEDSKTYTWNMSSTIDLTGIPRLAGSGVTIDASNATAAICFTTIGTRSAALASGISISEGETISATISTANLDIGDTLVICSVEALPNTMRAEYYKSGSFTVYSNNGIGTITVNPPVPYDFTTSAYLYKITHEKLVLEKGLTFLGDKTAGGVQSCFQFAFANVYVESSFNGFQGEVCRYVTSIGHFYGDVNYIQGDDGAAAFDGTGVEVHDASDVIINARINGGFHAVDAGGAVGAYWDGTYAGSSGTMALSSRFTISGGLYSSNSGAAGTINAHGNADTVAVGNCIVSGSSVNVSSRYANISNVTIEGESTVCLGLGADNDSKSWGKYKISNVQMKRYTTINNASGALTFTEFADEIDISNITAEADCATTAVLQTPVVFTGECNRLTVDGVKIVRGATNTGRGLYAELYASTEYEFRNITVNDNNRADFKAMAADVNLTLNNIKTKDSTGNGGIVLLIDTSMNWDLVRVIDCQGINGAAHGLDVTNVKVLHVVGGTYENNNQAGGRGIRALLTQEMLVTGADMRNNGQPIAITDYGSGSTLGVVGCLVSGNTGSLSGALGASCTWESRIGNMGDILDYFRQDDDVLYYYDQSAGAWVAV